MACHATYESANGPHRNADRSGGRDSRFGTKLGGEEGIVLRACLEISVGTLSYQRESLWGLARSRAWRPQPTPGIRPPCTYLLLRSNIHVSATVNTSSQTRSLTDRNWIYWFKRLTNSRLFETLFSNHTFEIQFESWWKKWKISHFLRSVRWLILLINRMWSKFAFVEN